MLHYSFQLRLRHSHGHVCAHAEGPRRYNFFLRWRSLVAYAVSLGHAPCLRLRYLSNANLVLIFALRHEQRRRNEKKLLQVTASVLRLCLVHIPEQHLDAWGHWQGSATCCCCF